MTDQAVLTTLYVISVIVWVATGFVARGLYDALLAPRLHSWYDLYVKKSYGYDNLTFRKRHIMSRNKRLN